MSDCQVGIVIPGSRIPDVFLNPESRDWQSPNPGISGLKKMYFSVETSIYSMIFAVIRKKLFSHTLTLTLLSPPATMLQVATAFFHSWLTRSIATVMNAIKAETALFDSTGKRGSCLETSVLVFIDCPTNIGRR